MSKGQLVKSSFNKKSYNLYVSLPSGYNPADATRYPVLYVLDANYSYPLLFSLHHLFDTGNEIEKVIIVAIGDEDKSREAWLSNRTFDYTISADPVANADIARGANLPADLVKSGGAKAFLSTIVSDIIPYVDRHYKTTADRGIAGHSLGGLFVGYCMFASPKVFSRYGINSPSFLWNNNEILTTEETFAAKHSVLTSRVFISVGSLEPQVMLPPINTFVAKLKEHNYEGLDLTTEVFQNESHISVVAASLSRTLRVLYSFSSEK